MSVFVLVHGGAHGGWCYNAVAEILRSHGHEVHAPTLSGISDRAHVLSDSINLSSHIADIAQTIEYFDLRGVVLAGHSYGGMVITGAADRVADRIGHLVYLDAATPANKQSLSDISPGINYARQSARTVDGIELALFPGTEPLPHYGITDPDDIAWVDARLSPHPWACFEERLDLQNEAELWRIPQTHVVCTSTLESRRNNPQTAAARAAGRFWDIDTGHDLMITEPAVIAEFLERAAGSRATNAEATVL